MIFIFTKVNEPNVELKSAKDIFIYLFKRRSPVGFPPKSLIINYF